MRRRTLANGAVVAAALLTAAGLTVAVASAATSQPTATASSSATPTYSTSVPASSVPTSSTSATVSASPSASSSSDGSECANVYLVTAPAGDAVGKLCTAVTASGTTISGVAITYTASSSCSGSLNLRVSGVDQKNAEFGAVKTVTCSSDTATASFTPVSEVASDTFICGMLLSDKYTAAEACVAIS